LKPRSDRLLVGMRILEGMFFIGIVGSAVVLVLTEDVRELLGHKDG
jgi:hypothetical protein